MGTKRGVRGRKKENAQLSYDTTCCIYESRIEKLRCTLSLFPSLERVRLDRYLLVRDAGWMGKERPRRANPAQRRHICVRMKLRARPPPDSRDRLRPAGLTVLLANQPPPPRTSVAGRVLFKNLLQNANAVKLV